MPALFLEPAFISARPIHGKPLFGKEFREDDVAILYDLDFDGQPL